MLRSNAGKRLTPSGNVYLGAEKEPIQRGMDVLNGGLHVGVDVFLVDEHGHCRFKSDVMRFPKRPRLPSGHAQRVWYCTGTSVASRHQGRPRLPEFKKGLFADFGNSEMLYVKHVQKVQTRTTTDVHPQHVSKSQIHAPLHHGIVTLPQAL
jgi:hypothetical protein